MPRNLHYLTDRLPKANYEPIRTRSVEKMDFIRNLSDRHSRRTPKKASNRLPGLLSATISKGKKDQSSIISDLNKITDESTAIIHDISIRKKDFSADPSPNRKYLVNMPVKPNKKVATVLKELDLITKSSKEPKIVSAGPERKEPSSILPPIISKIHERGIAIKRPVNVDRIDQLSRVYRPTNLSNIQEIKERYRSVSRTPVRQNKYQDNYHAKNLSLQRNVENSVILKNYQRNIN